MEDLEALAWDDLMKQVRSAGGAGGRRALSPRQQALWRELTRRVELLAGQSGVQSALTDDDRQEVVQLAMVKLLSLKDRGGLDHIESAESYLRRLVRNTAIDLIRQRLQRSKHMGPWDDRLDAPDIAADELLINQEVLRALKTELDRLSPSDRELIVLRFSRGMTFAAIAESKGATYSAIAVRMFRLLGRLRARIEPQTGRKRPSK